MTRSYGTTQEPKVSVVIINFRGTEHLKKCLKSLLETDYKNFEVIIVDCLTQGINQWIKKNFPSIRVIHFCQDIGAAASHNIGFEESSGQLVAFLDNDTKVDKKWLKELVKTMETDSTIGVAQGQILFIADKNRINSTGGIIDRYGFQCSSGFGEKVNEKLEYRKEISFALGTGFIVRRDAFIRAGLYDSDFFLFMDEVDFCWRVWLSGYKVVSTSAPKVYHVGAGSLTIRNAERAYYYSHRNHIRTLIKNYTLSNFPRYICQVIVLFFIYDFVLLLKGKIKKSIPCLRAFWDIIRNFRAVWREHIKIQHLIRRVSDKYMFEYFIKSQKPLFYRAYKQQW